MRFRNPWAGAKIPNGEDIGLSELCVYTIVLALILIIIFIIYYLYFRAHGLKSGKKHRCNYCGELVDVISNCCHAPVIERFLIGVCQKCGKECKTICFRCRKHIAG
ncbi:MAG: hypothetical protein V3U20_09340 [Thermoplasmata archaeon]